MVTTMRDSRVTAPELPPRYVSRPRLLAALDRAAHLPLTLLCAGPGAGKTALLADWAGHAKAEVAWLSLAAADAEPGRFWQLLESALPGDEGAATGSLGVIGDTGLDLARSLLSRIPDGEVPLVVVIDDAHVLDHPDILDGLDGLIRSRQPGLRIVLATRSDPLLPLHKYRLAGQLFELRATDLAMTPHEAREVLAIHGVTLPQRDFDLLMARTEGWAAGMRLSAMRMEGAEDPGSFVTQLALDRGSIGEYLVDEVLRRQPERHRQLLVETSFLDEVTGPLADAVTGIAGSGEVLAELARTNSFVIPVDPLHTRFRYHQLFGEILRYLLQGQAGPAVRRLKQRAAAWFEANGELGRAIHWAAQADDGPHAAALLARGGFVHAFVRRLDLSGLGLRELLPTSGPLECAIASHAIDAVSASPNTAEPLLERLRAWRRETPLTDQDLIVTHDLTELIVGQKACDYQAVDAAASRLLRATGDAGDGKPPALRAAVLLAQASTHLWHGKHEDVGTLLDEALAHVRHDAPDELELEVLGMAAFAYSFWARTSRSDQAARRAYAVCKRSGLRAPPALDLAAALRALVSGNLSGGSMILQRVSLPGGVGCDPGLAAALALGRASVLLAQGQEAEARSILHEQADHRIPPILGACRDIMLASLDTARGRPRSAAALLAEYQGTEFAVLTATARARALLALNDLRGARDCVRTVLTTPSAQTGRLTLVDAMLCDAQLTLESGDPGRALEILIHAIEVARDEIKLPFRLTGSSFTDLLARHPDVAARWPLPRDTEATAPLVPMPRASRELPDPLTPRELTILRLLATSMSTAEIADELYLSVNTVKTHLAAIYRKLPASRRREAVLRARELELI
jgi:LuxR family transcriptional regulator, maltose regulon positive regulatory protein